MNMDLIRRAYAAIGDATPLQTDCGKLCQAACCAADGDGQGGVCLLPPEEAALREIDWGKIDYEPRMNAPMLMCTGSCERTLRPFLCRIFPLCPVLGRSGKWTVRMDARARAACPLARSGVTGLDPDFVRGCVQAVRILAGDAQGEAFLTRWAEIEAEFRKPVF